MAAYVDELYPTPRTERWPHTQACHLTADTDTELHQMAEQLGLKRAWAQKTEHPHQYMHHYDLTPGRRKKAIDLGAIEETRVGAARRIIAAGAGGRGGGLDVLSTEVVDTSLR